MLEVFDLTKEVIKQPKCFYLIQRKRQGQRMDLEILRCDKNKTTGIINCFLYSPNFFNKVIKEQKFSSFFYSTKK